MRRCVRCGELKDPYPAPEHVCKDLLHRVLYHKVHWETEIRFNGLEEIYDSTGVTIGWIARFAPHWAYCIKLPGMRTPSSTMKDWTGCYPVKAHCIADLWMNRVCGGNDE